MKKLRLPPELVSEIATALPFDIRWATIRVSTNFDHFVGKCQSVWILQELARQKILHEKRQHLVNAKRELKKVIPKLEQGKLTSLGTNLALHFGASPNYGLSGEEAKRMTPQERYLAQMEALIKDFVDQNDAVAVNNIANFLFGQVDDGLRAVGHQRKIAKMGSGGGVGGSGPGTNK
ncbi:hypothetical protein niasHT_033059 [Heterodera trifolii]|uniref:F-box domain-containing protein n=1 Tax=Heterodera trifolii TaxID=157864 RepID=A0ABD2J5G0_9BILA